MARKKGKKGLVGRRVPEKVEKEKEGEGEKQLGKKSKS